MIGRLKEATDFGEGEGFFLGLLHAMLSPFLAGCVADIVCKILSPV